MGGLDSKPILAFCVSISSYSPVGFLIDTGWSASAADQDKLSVLILFQIINYSLPEGLEKCRINLVGAMMEPPTESTVKFIFLLLDTD